MLHNIQLICTIDVTYAGEEVTGGQIEIDLKWGFIPVPAQKQDLCTALKNGGKSCPLEPGTQPQTMSISQTIPSEAPSVSHHTRNTQSLLFNNGDFCFGVGWGRKPGG